MAERAYCCPECRTPFAETGLTVRGPFLECPNCQLLFQSRREEIPGAATAKQSDAEWAAHGLAVKGAPADKPAVRGLYRTPLQPVGRRKRRLFRLSELSFATAPGLGIVAIVVGIFLFVQRSVTDAKSLIESLPKSVVDTPLIVSIPNTEDLQPPAVAIEKPPPTTDRRLHGEWDATDQPIENPEGGEVYAILLSPDGAALIRARHKLETETITGRWKLTDFTLTLNFGKSRLTAAVEFAGDDRMRLRIAGQNPVEFARKPPE